MRGHQTNNQNSSLSVGQSAASKKIMTSPSMKHENGQSRQSTNSSTLTPKYKNLQRKLKNFNMKKQRLLESSEDEKSVAHSCSESHQGAVEVQIQFQNIEQNNNRYCGSYAHVPQRSVMKEQTVRQGSSDISQNQQPQIQTQSQVSPQVQVQVQVQEEQEQGKPETVQKTIERQEEEQVKKQEEEEEREEKIEYKVEQQNNGQRNWKKLSQTNQSTMENNKNSSRNNQEEDDECNKCLGGSDNICLPYKNAEITKTNQKQLEIQQNKIKLNQSQTTQINQIGAFQETLAPACNLPQNQQQHAEQHAQQTVISDDKQGNNVDQINDISMRLHAAMRISNRLDSIQQLLSKLDTKKSIYSNSIQEFTQQCKNNRDSELRKIEQIFQLAGELAAKNSNIKYLMSHS